MGVDGVSFPRVQCETRITNHDDLCPGQPDKQRGRRAAPDARRGIWRQLPKKEVPPSVASLKMASRHLPGATPDTTTDRVWNFEVAFLIAAHEWIHAHCDDDGNGCFV
jgi:hypothetical protein